MQPMEQKQQTREEFIKGLFVLENPDNIISGKEARKRLIKGIDKTVDSVKSAYGSAGSNCLIEEYLYPYSSISNDGKKIVQDIKLQDKVENMGANIVKECADRTDKGSGDGRKTSMILLQAIIKEGLKHDVDPILLKKSLDQCLPIIAEQIDMQTKQITEKEVGKIAEIASESKELGVLFQEIYEKIGKEGICELDNSGLPTTFYEFGEGVKLLNCGFTWPYMINDDKGQRAIFSDPKILITKQKLSSINELDAILKQVSNKGKNELVIFADEIDMPVSQALAYLSGGVTPKGQPIPAFKVLVIKAPTLWKDWLFEDFAKITHATIVDPVQGKSLRNFQYSWLGTCEKIITTKDETHVLGVHDIKDHIDNLKRLNTNESMIRIARLQTKTAVLKLGANSDAELSYIRGKALDGRNASYLALNYGVVRGGGQCLANIAQKLPESTGGQILKEALQYPLKLILKNSGIESIPSNVKDPAVVVKTAITNALSIASTILTVENIILKPIQ